jgi:hypothetical protein
VKAYGPDLAGKIRKMAGVRSSNTVIMSGGGILPVPARTDHNCDNPATGYDQRITASTFLQFSGVFAPETATLPRFLPEIHGTKDRNHCPGNDSNKEMLEMFKWVQFLLAAFK